ncbi:MAG TPA: FAD:protein FMN transferase [Candidatus Polarisedimenticolia bacterium]|nr:FAD:protein FMN transferase [Candidatus Polarisedimenticolia bacterium]
MTLRSVLTRAWRVDPVLLLTVAVVSAGGAVAEAPRAAASASARARFLMGTRLSIETSEPAPEAAFESAFEEVARLEQVLSNWRNTSEVARLNHEAAARAFVASPDLFASLEAALRWAAVTDGAFDPTVEPLVRALRVRDPEGDLPGEHRPDDAGEPSGQAPVGWRHVRLGSDGKTVRFDRRGVGVDFGGIGKGIALDAAARVLAEHGVKSALLDFGGQLLATGKTAAGTGWRVGIADPEERDRAVATLRLESGSIATSGNSERATRDASGTTVGHIIDPARRAPAAFAGAVTVLSGDATAADALSTALFVMGPERGVAWGEARGIAVLYLRRRPDGTLERKATRSFDTAAADRRGPGEVGHGN